MTSVSASAGACDAIVIGGGFYGSAIAVYLATQRRLSRTVLIEQDPRLLARASFNNQARIHNGYHYPRSFTTAYRSRINLPRFVHDWPDSVRKDFTKIYAIARRNSQTSARQFERFCQDIGAPVARADDEYRALFDGRLVEDVFLVEEHAFDAQVLAARLADELRNCYVDVRLNTRAKNVSRTPDGYLRVGVDDATGAGALTSTYVFNCSYSGLNQLSGEFAPTRSRLKHEVTEMALINVPRSLAGLGVTVMDGPFFSVMPFPARDLHTLSHVRYTPHLHWADRPGVDPYDKLQASSRTSRFEWMVRDAARYMPMLAKAEHVDSLYEVKTVLTRNESDDGRPILFERHTELPGCYSILGGKIDNIYDVLEKLDAEPLAAATADDRGGVA